MFSYSPSNIITPRDRPWLFRTWWISVWTARRGRHSSLQFDWLMARKIVQFLLKKRSWRLGVSNNGVNKSHLDTESRYVLWFCSLSMRNRLLETRLTYDSIWTPDTDYVSFSLHKPLLMCFMSHRENRVWTVCSCYSIGMSISLVGFYDLNIVIFHLETMTSFFTGRGIWRRIWMRVSVDERSLVTI